MHRQAIIRRAKKLLVERKAQNDRNKVHLNFGNNPPPVDYNGPVLQFFTSDNA